ncbi:MAG: hypothetical protein AB1805_13650 [Nitrospirota bacterium]
MKARKEIVRRGTKIGAAIGGIIFVIFGLLPGVYFGSYGSLMVIKHLTGSVEPSAIVRIVTAVGILLGVFCIGAVSVVVGSILGTVSGYLYEAVAGPKEAKEGAEAKAKAH